MISRINLPLEETSSNFMSKIIGGGFSSSTFIYVGVAIILIIISVGVYYQYILLDIIKNKAFAREIMKHMDHLKNSIVRRKKMILAI